MKLKVSQLAKKLNKTTMTIWNYMSQKKLRFHQDFPRANRYFLCHEVLEDLGIETPKENKIVIGYCRVSTQDQKQDLVYQRQLVEQYCSSKGYNHKIIEDIGSGINYTKKGLKELIKLISDNQISRIVIVHKDRLLRFGNEIIFELCKLKDIEVEIINQSENESKEEELVKDVLQVITVFSSRLYGQRSHKNKQILEENKKLWKKEVIL